MEATTIQYSTVDHVGYSQERHAIYYLRYISIRGKCDIILCAARWTIIKLICSKNGPVESHTSIGLENIRIWQSMSPDRDQRALEHLNIYLYKYVHTCTYDSYYLPVQVTHKSPPCATACTAESRNGAA